MLILKVVSSPPGFRCPVTFLSSFIATHPQAWGKSTWKRFFRHTPQVHECPQSSWQNYYVFSPAETMLTRVRKAKDSTSLYVWDTAPAIGSPRPTPDSGTPCPSCPGAGPDQATMDLGLAGRRALVTGAGKGKAAGEGRWRQGNGVPALTVTCLRHRAQHGAGAAGGGRTRRGREPDPRGP